MVNNHMYYVALLLFLVGSSYGRSLYDNGTDYNIENRAGNMLYNGKLWPGGVIPYTFSEEVDSGNCQGSNCTVFKETIINLTKWFNENSNNCIKFRPMVTRDFYYLKFVYDPDDCHCQMGVIGTRESLCSLNSKCHFAHFLLHVLGMDDERRRIDRDAYVEVLWDNIYSGREHLRIFEHGISATLCVPYQFDSVMNILPKGVIPKDDPRTRNRTLPIMTFRHPPKEHINLFSDREYPTDMDMYRIRLAYGCIDCEKPTECADEFKFQQTALKNDSVYYGTYFGGEDTFTDCRNPDINEFVKDYLSPYKGGNWCSTKVNDTTLFHIENTTHPWANRRECQCKRDLCSDPMPITTTTERVR